MKNIILILIICIVALPSCTGDTFRDHVRRGNRCYVAATDSLCKDSSLIYDACTEYERAISRDSTIAIAHYNAGNSYLLTGKDSTAFHEYMLADSLETDFIRQAHIHRNIGVLLQTSSLQAPDSVKNSLLQGAVENYKSSLRYEPDNNETRYNLALCQWQLKKNQQDNQGSNGGSQGDNNDEQQQDQKQQQQQQQQQQDQQQQDQQRQNQASEQMIKAAMQRERETQNRMNQYDRAKRMEEEQQQTMPRKLQKNW